MTAELFGESDDGSHPGGAPGERARYGTTNIGVDFGVARLLGRVRQEPGGAVRKLCCGSVVDTNDRLLVRHDCDLATMADSEGKVFHIG